MQNLLIMATARGVAGTAQLPKALVAAGFNVGAIAPEGALVLATRYLSVGTRLPGTIDAQALWDAVVGVARLWPFDFVIPGDDWAVRYLDRLADHCEDTGVTGAIADAILKSAVRREHRRTIERKGTGLTLAEMLGAKVPAHIRPGSPEEVREFCRLHGLPVVVKSELSTSGAGVFVLDDMERVVEAAMGRNPTGINVPWSPEILLLQRFVQGTPASITLACHNGRVLAAFCYAAERWSPQPTGPATVIRVIDRPDMVEIARRVAEHLGFTGLFGLDFMIEDGTDEACFIEINPRPPQTAYLGALAGSDVCGALHAAFAGRTLAPRLQGEIGRRIALFPGEWMRDPESPFLREAVHPVPWEDGDLIAACVKRGTKRSRQIEQRAPAVVSFRMAPPT